MIELRYLVRGGEKVLQYRYDVVWSDWQDVPTVDTVDESIPAHHTSVTGR